MYRTTRIVLLFCAAIGITAHAVGQAPTQAVKISDSVYMAPTTGNVYMVTTPAGNVIIDTALEAQAADAKKVLQAVNQGPVKYIILTHTHADHIGGISLWKGPGTQIIAQRDSVEFLNYTTRLEGFFAPRNAAGFSRPVQEVGAWAGNYGAKIDTTLTFDQKYEFTLGGIKFELFSTPGETPDHLDSLDSGLQGCLYWRQLRWGRNSGTDVVPQHLHTPRYPPSPGAGLDQVDRHGAGS